MRKISVFWEEKIVGKGEIACYRQFSFSRNVFFETIHQGREKSNLENL